MFKCVCTARVLKYQTEISENSQSKLVSFSWITKQKLWLRSPHEIIKKTLSVKLQLKTALSAWVGNG